MDNRILGLLKDARRQLEQERELRTAPIAIVGIGCRFPGGASSPARFWQLLLQGTDATSEVPPDRWDADSHYDPDPDAPGKAYVKRGGFLERIDGFDPEFFGISPREALGMDPQQRLLLEVSWEALEDAGIPAEQLRGSATGVWVGLCVDDYARRSVTSGDLTRIDPYSALGNTRSIAAGRIAYVLDLRGPVVQLDTACSSSLVAVHQACQSLRSGEADFALAGGVNLMASPEATIALCKLRALSRDGRCKTFDASADGYARGEGCGIVVLKRLADAQAAGDRIYAVIRGSAVNHDGRSNGLTAPNGLAQEAVIRSALANGGLEAKAVGYVEAHGTGTLLGDPVEVLALSRVYGQDRSATAPLHLGTVKANFGHLEGAAGIAGVIKAALCLAHGRLVPQLNLNTPNPKIPWERLPVRVATAGADWPRDGDQARFAGVSSFGLSGTNAHAILEEPPLAATAPAAAGRSAELVLLSAKSPAALRALSAQLHEHVASDPGLALPDVAYTLLTARSLLDERLAFTATDREALLRGLLDGARGELPPGGALATARAQHGTLGWLFTGQGAQQLGMGRALYDEWPAFRSAFDAACSALDPNLEHPLKQIMWADPGSPQTALLDQTVFTQPALFALEWALAQLWRSWSVEPDALLGHSIGEISAATVAGVFSLEDAARLVCARGRLMQALPAGGAMVSIAASESEVSTAVARFAASVAVAAVNSPDSTVISGSAADVLAVAEAFAARRVQTKRLTVSHAFHSPLMDPMLAAFREVAQSITYHAPSLQLVSNVSGELAGEEICTADYWVRHVREAVRFSQGVQAAYAAGIRTFVEIGPKPTLLGLTPASLPTEVTLFAALRSGRSEPESVLEALGAWLALGGSCNHQPLFPAGARRVELPTYPWQRERYWQEVARSSLSGTGGSAQHPLLGTRLPAAETDAVYETVLSLRQPAWLTHHRVAGRVVFPAAAFAELLLAAFEDYRQAAGAHVGGLVLQAPLLVPERGALRVQVILAEEGRRASVHSQPLDATPGSPWLLHATAAMNTAAIAPRTLNVQELRARCPQLLNVADIYEALASHGLAYGPSFQGLRAISIGEREALAELALGEATEAEQYALHPALLDAALQASAALLAGQDALLPFEIGSVVVHRPGATKALAHIVLRESAGEQARVDIVLADETGAALAEVSALRLRRVQLASLGHTPTQAPPNAMYRLEWQPTPAPAPAAASGQWLVLQLGEDLGGSALVSALRERGASAELVSASGLAGRSGADHVVCLWGQLGSDASTAIQAAQQGLTAIHALQQVRGSMPHLWWVTRRAVSVRAEEDVSAAAAALWGLGRTLMAEQPELRCTLLDAEPQVSLPELLLGELGARDDEGQVAWRRGARFVARLVPARPTPSLLSAANYRLEAQNKGTLDSLALVPADRRTPQPGEVEIEVFAAGLNFRDVLNALGMYPGDAGALGNECAGTVSATGSGVLGLQVGDRVMALAPGAFQRFVTVDARLVSRAPDALSFEQAASVPIVFLTAWYALHELARLQPGETLLVHAAAGGVGMAAVQLAQRLGAKVLATASPAKWETVRGLGVSHVESSRNLEFAPAFRKAGGADVVLNALSGDFIDASLSLLSAGGRFLEMGKIDLRDPAAVAAAHPGVSYRAFDLAELSPEHIARILAAIRMGFESGELTPLPVRTFPLADAEAAFRFMAQARHIGKVVLLSPGGAARAEQTVLITGGLGALGLELARHFARRGIKHLVLTGRRGLKTPGAPEAVAELRTLGAEVTVAAVDAADRGAFQQVLQGIPLRYPLRGVVHAAGVVDDGLLAEQTGERFANVLAPKVRGAFNLHSLTRELPLDFFVLFSSVAGSFGSAAQAAYAAANAYLDALAALRRAQGLPAQSLAWGPWSERGMAAGLDAKLQARFARQGLAMLAPAQALALFDEATQRSEAHLLLVPVDRRVATRAFGASVPSLWRALLRAPSVGATPAGAWATELSALSAERRSAEALSLVRTEIARVLSLAGPSEVPRDRPLQELGLDSLMAVELRNALARQSGVALSATIAFDYPTPEAIAGYLLTQLRFNAAEPAVATASVHAASEEPIAVVGIGCRFPGGVSDPASFWRLLDGGVDAITEVPKERWDIDQWYDPDPDAPGKMTTRWGGFLQNLDRFDAAFFGISPREAASVDPQERLLLETTWEALEHAGLQPDALMGSDTGVYMGLCGTEYQSRVMADVDTIDAYAGLGTMHSTMVGRLSYWLGLKGPNLPIDTACSSSLVAVHLACQALRSGECSLALAGGANVLLEPQGMVYFSRLRAMSPTGRCHTFSEDADGYVRAEGAGVVVLERLADARRNGHPILAVIRGTAVNQDGRSNGLTAPNGPSQQAVIREALRRANVSPSDVGFVECHGTGTPLGDPIEVQALGAVLADGRDAENPVVLGSLKSNVGHMEGAAGIGGLIKAVLCLQHGRIPKSLHFNSPNPHISWSELPVRVASEALDWPRNGKPRIAGVSSFGISGTNAHALLEEAPTQPAPPSALVRSAELIVLSARSAPALDAAAARLDQHLAAHLDIPLGDLAFSLLATRSLMDHRFAVVVSSRETLVHALASATRGECPVGAARAIARDARGTLAWLFTGQGAQASGMGRELYREWPAFRSALDACCAALDLHLASPLKQVMWAEPGSPEASLLDQTAFTQPALFALEWALAQLWRSWGIEPDVLLGHSVGEITAAAFAGVFSLADAARLVCARARLMQAQAAGGAMVSIAAPESDVSLAVAPYAASVAIAALNSPASTVISGAQADVLAIAEVFAARGVQSKRLSVSHAFHSPLMDPMLEAFREVAESITYHSPSLRLVSNLTGALAGHELCSADYWVRHVRQAVRFSQGVQSLYAAGIRTFIEIGPKPTLLGLVPASLSAEVTLLASLRHPRSESESILEALAGWLALGGTCNPNALFASGARRVELPNYPWQRERYWVEPSLTAPRASGERSDHPLLGPPITVAGVDAVYESILSANEPSWLADHRVGTLVVVPAAAITELLHAAAENHRQGPARLEHVLLQEPIILADHTSQRLQIIVTAQGTRASLYSQPARSSPGAPWTLNASADLADASPTPADTLNIVELRGRCTEPVDIRNAYQAFDAAGLAYGPRFQGMQSLWRGTGEAFAEVALHSSLTSDAYALHPALLDASLQAAAAIIPSRTALVPFEVGSLDIYQPGATRAFVHVRLGSSSPDGAVVDVSLLDESGTLLARLSSIHLRRVDVASLGPKDTQALPNAFYSLDWLPVPLSSAPPASGSWLIVSFGETQEGQTLCQALRSGGAQAELVTPAEFANILQQRTGALHVVALWKLGERDAAAAIRVAQQALALTQAVGASSAVVRLWWVTWGAVAVDPEEDVAAATSTLWGLGRTLMAEQPELRLTLIDLGPEGPSLAEVLSAECASVGDETQIAWRSVQRFAARLVRAPGLPALPSSSNYQLEAHDKGTLDNLVLVAAERRVPQPGEVEIEIRAAGLNFRDVLNALGLYPGEAGPLGGECSGVVTSVGEGVHHVHVGDAVMALGFGTFRRFVTLDAQTVCCIPRGVSLEQAAGIPIAFATAWYALRDLARLEPGERILIHAAAGGVGMAAVQLAHALGAEVLATASPAKWESVRALGVESIASSRNLDFAKVFRTGPPHVVLNALAREFVDVSLSLLSAGGRFIEMGKTDLRDPDAVAAAHAGVAYHAFDLAQVPRERLGEILEAIRNAFDSGQLQPLPLRTFAFTEAEAAFRFMAQARHIGKIVLVPRADALRSEQTVLITGGLGALGLAVARHLAERGVKRLLLTGRRGVDTPGAAQAIAEIEALGAEVTVGAVDVADRTALARLLEDIPAHLPLRGVVHAAGVIDDGLLVEQTDERFVKVLSPKVLGAINLHELTRGASLDFFVAFSSIAASVGSAAQGAYAAANAFLDAFARHRRAQGLPAISLAWGPWSGGGMAGTLDPKLQARFKRQGLSLLAPQQALALFDDALRRNDPHLLIVPIDRRVAARAFGVNVPPLWRSLIRAATSPATSASSAGWLEGLLAMGEQERLPALTALVQEEVARVLSLKSAAAVATHVPLQDLGLDSLTALELRSTLARRTGAPLPASVALDHPTVAAIAEYLHARLSSNNTPAPAALSSRTPAVSAPSREPEAPSRQEDGVRTLHRHENGDAARTICECIQPLQSARVRLFCFHDAGGTPAMFAPFAELAANGVEVHTISPLRTAELTPGSGMAYVREAIDYVRARADKPYALFGHSLGALFAWHTLQHLAQTPLRQPLLYMASSHPPGGHHQRGNGSVAEAFRMIMGNKAESLDSLRADFTYDVQLWQSIPELPAPLTSVPIVAFAGANDHVFSEDEVRQWEGLTDTHFSLYVFPGGHFYLHEEAPRRLLLAAIQRELSGGVTAVAPSLERNRAVTRYW